MSAWNDFYANQVTLDFTLDNLCGHRKLLKAVEKCGPSRVLEVGVGTGTMSWFLAARGLQVVGLDYEERILERARLAARAVPCVTYVKGDAFALAEQFTPRSFDVAFSQGFFEHFDDDEVRTLVRQQLAVAERVVFSVPSDQYPQTDFGNERLMPPSDWLRILEGVGTVHAEYYGEVRYGIRARLKGFPARRSLHVLVTITAGEQGR